jgi:SAM-dependent methyltransferase
MNPAANGSRAFVDEGNLTYGNGLTKAFYSWFPTLGSDSTMLDLGCGYRRFEDVCQVTGAEYIALDVDGSSPHVLGRGEALPFKDESLDFVLSIATLPHTEHPSLATHEINRVLRPGCLFMGTSQFLEPCFMASRHHGSALGVIDWLDDGGLEILFLEPNLEWDAFLALAGMSYFPCTGAGRLLPLFKSTVTQLHRWLWKLSPPKERQVENKVYYGQGSPEAYTAGFRFIARKPIVGMH